MVRWIIGRLILLFRSILRFMRSYSWISFWILFGLNSDCLEMSRSASC